MKFKRYNELEEYVTNYGYLDTLRTIEALLFKIPKDVLKKLILFFANRETSKLEKVKLNQNSILYYLVSKMMLEIQEKIVSKILAIQKRDYKKIIELTTDFKAIANELYQEIDEEEEDKYKETTLDLEMKWQDITELMLFGKNE